ncbi:MULTISPECIES: hypothetical protein [unclassified Nostoc]|uniref:hypothetical protein n=1 Tax=unclassified Nostoc TaxID=2593658 RepID=UPI001D6851CC|nr:hypothetical protein [Nostoc sp. JL23]MBN3875058.1 hypothetical protein [Nostoc sp. JL23]
MMLRLSNARNFFILMCLFFFYSYDANSSSTAAAIDNQPKFLVNKRCNISFDPQINQFTLGSNLTVNAQSPRARCIIRINISNTQKQFRLVPLALKGVVKKAPAQIAISSFLVGEKPTPYQMIYGSAMNFDLTNQILPTNYTSTGKSVLAINLVLTTNGGELELTDMKFALQ